MKKDLHILQMLHNFAVLNNKIHNLSLLTSNTEK